MELHPILDKGTSPNKALWYVLSALGECPSQRVGHTATYISGPEGHDGGKVYIIGGANPNGPFSDVYVLDLDTLSWDTIDAPGLKARYEHSAFVPESMPDKIYVFGGADQGGNHNDLQVFDVTSKTWSTVVTRGNAPCARTYHVMTCTGDRFVVYSGGQSGTDPIGDRQVHVFDAGTANWSVLNVKGDPPKPRHGHLVVATGDKVYVHGGMSGTTFYDDLHVLDLKAATWRSVKQKRGHPCGRAAHSGAIFGSDLYIFGGMNRDGALDDLHKLDTGSLKWTTLPVEGPPPASRLDYAMVMVTLRVPAVTLETPEDLAASRVTTRDVLDTQLRLGSAGSARSLGSAGSVGSAGSQRSTASVGSATGGGSARGEDVMTNDTGAESLVLAGSQLPPPDVTPGAATGGGDDHSVEYKTVNMCLIYGGMDTEGEIFDDCLVYLLD